MINNQNEQYRNLMKKVGGTTRMATGPVPSNNPKPQPPAGRKNLEELRKKSIADAKNQPPRKGCGSCRRNKTP